MPGLGRRRARGAERRPARRPFLPPRGSSRHFRVRVEGACSRARRRLSSPPADQTTSTPSGAEACSANATIRARATRWSSSSSARRSRFPGLEAWRQPPGRPPHPGSRPRYRCSVPAPAARSSPRRTFPTSWTAPGRPCRARRGSRSRARAPWKRSLRTRRRRTTRSRHLPRQRTRIGPCLSWFPPRRARTGPSPFAWRPPRATGSDPAPPLSEACRRRYRRGRCRYRRRCR